MTRTFFKSLDREFEILGLKGRWVRNFLYCAGGSVVAGVIFGFMTSTAVGFTLVLLGLAGGFFYCLTAQSRLPGRRIEKSQLSPKVEGWVLRRESLSRIMLEDSRFDEVKSILAQTDAAAGSK